MKPRTFPMIAILFLIVIFTSGALGQSFNPVLDSIKRFQQGENIELFTRVKGDTFTVFRKEVTNINKESLDRLSAPSLPQNFRLRYRDNSVFRVFKISDDLELEEQVSTGPKEGAGFWTKIENIPIATYPITQWPGFVKATYDIGLAGYGQDILGPTLYFRSVGPSRFQYGPQSLTLTEKFYEFMRLSKDHQPFVGSNGFVVIVHDPHASRAGRLQLLPGLKALIDGNNQNSYIFLVEGEFNPEDRTIGFNTLDKTLDRVRSTAATEPLVYSLLSRYLIDCSLAYRLIYDPKLPALAIDDPAYFKKGVPASYPNDPTLMLWHLAKIERVSQKSKLSPPDFKQLRELISAELKETGGQSELDYFNSIATAAKTLADAAEKLEEVDPTLDDDIAYLRSQFDAYSSEARISSDALKRDVLMAQLISEQANWKNRKIPIAFIGSFHTAGITQRLKDQNIGYVVVEPRSMGLGNYYEELEEFHQYIYPGSREDFIRQATARDKGPVLPTITEVQKYYDPFIERESRNIQRRDSSSKQSFARVSRSHINYDALREAVTANGAMTGAQLNFEGGIGAGNELPPMDGAFAYFELGGPGKDPRLTIVDPSDPRWNASTTKARYNCLRETQLIEDWGFESRGRANLYRDRDSKVLLVTFFEPKSGRFYFLDGEKLDNILAFLRPAQLMHLRLAELERLRQRRARKNERSKSGNG